MDKKQSAISYVFSIVKGDRRKLALGMMLSIICSALSFVPYVVIYKIILKLIGGTIDFQFVLFWALIAITAAILQAVLMACAGICSHIAAFNTMHKVKIKVLEHISKLSLGFFNDNDPGKLKSAMFDDIGRLEGFIAHHSLELAQSIVVPIILFVALLFIQPVMTICLLIPAVLGIIIPMKMISSYPELTSEYTKTVGNLTSAVSEFIGGMPVIKMYNLTAEKFSKYINALSLYTNCLKNMAKISCRPLAVTIVILDSGILFTLPIGGLMYLNGVMPLETYLIFILLSMCFYNALFNLMNIKMGTMELESGLVNIRKIMDTQPVSSGSVCLPKEKCYGIEFDNVTFNYGRKEALSNVSLNLKSGTLTAFVGASGAGKTTAAQLLGRYWNTTDGEIRIGGVPINELTTESLMNLTAFVFQDVFLMEDTLFQNICMGSEATEEQVVAAAKAAQIDDFIRSLPRGYQTCIGDTGVKLSGGQKQRISIARAILKDTPIVIFDEATSYTDIENEHKIQIALQSLLKNKTTIMIAHRLHTIKNADNIVVFDNGKVVEQGKHRELIASGGLYSDMWSVYTKESIEKEVV